ncbi:MAG: signal peptidase [Actinomycetota bacterium]|nr:signal peptidase [Actinomycetota bacterium]
MAARPVAPVPGERRLTQVIRQIRETVVIVTVAVILSLLIKTFLVQAFSIPSISMSDTLKVNDRVVVSKLTPQVIDLRRGDVVVFKDPGGWLSPAESSFHQTGPLRVLSVALTFVGLLPHDAGEHLIKRVIGLPGDTVVCCDAEQRLTVNGTAVTEPYLRPGEKPSEMSFTATVKPGHMWVMGDNRGHSSDSRFHRGLSDGQVPIDNVVGKAFAVVWPFSRFGTVPNPPKVFADIPAADPRKTPAAPRTPVRSGTPSVTGSP